MPRQPRLDDVIAHGIERREIFRADRDRTRVGVAIPRTVRQFGGPALAPEEPTVAP